MTEPTNLQLPAYTDAYTRTSIADAPVFVAFAQSIRQVYTIENGVWMPLPAPKSEATLSQEDPE